jgi:GH43 family beta-xylosidase
MTTHISRRALLQAGLGVGAALPLGALSAAPSFAAVTNPTDAEVYGVPATNPLVSQRADPFISRPVAGMYYFTGSVPEYDRLVLRGAPSIAGLTTAAETVIWRRPTTGRMGGHIWAPELHRIDGRWYVYFAAGDANNVFAIRMYVIESALDDPRDPAGWGTPREVTTPWGSFKLDATTFEHGGERYYVWAQAEPEIAVNTSLYIARMASPFELATDPVRISTPTRSWERQGFAVNEGPAVLVRGGKVFITFSASATDARYCMGLLTADADADLLDAASWTKTPDPVFVTNDQTKQYGPGHNSFTVMPDGTDVLVYHARDYRDITGDPLYDPNRHARVQRLYWATDGTPLLGVPVGVGGPIVRLSPAGVPGSHVRHRAFVLGVESDVRELADTQFRFVPGFAGSGSEAIQSVNYPDHYVRVVDGAVRLDPVEQGAAWASQASFNRVVSSRGVALQLVADRKGYLRHGSGTLDVGALSGGRSYFQLG